MLTLFEDILKIPQNFGAKTLNLVRLKQNKFNVPNFAAISNQTLLEIERNPQQLEILVKEITEKLNCTSYAVRSSALIEDTQNQSYAGQFTTELNTTKERLAEAITKVTKQGKEYLKGDLGKFSLIIQEFIDPDYAGVVFTRNPEGSREGVIEYFKGIGELLVSGQVKPEKINFYWNNIPTIHFIECSEEFFGNFKKIESLFNFPQDIEWCVKSKQIYIVQTRPITTINKAKFEEIMYLEKFLSDKKDFYFYKNELSQIIPRPSLFQLGLLDAVFAQTGPISEVYKNYGITYFPKTFWQVIGNELFVNRDIEIQTIIPSNFFDRYWNIWKLFRLNPIKEMKRDFIKEAQNLLDADANSDIKTSIDKFLNAYKYIFEVNLLAEKSLKNIEVIAKKEKIDVITILSGDLENCSEKLNLIKLDTSIKGNTLDILDTSEFFRTEFKNMKASEFERWWNVNLNHIQQDVYKNRIVAAQYFNKLREVGRWITAKFINEIRNNLFEYAKQKNFSDPVLILFADMQNIISGDVTEAKCIENKKLFESFKDFNLPKIISSSILDNQKNITFISGRKIEGILVNEATIDNVQRPKILLTKDLRPSLVNYFDQIDGIIAENGSLLSHLAIIARERGMSVVIVPDIEKFRPGEKFLLNSL